MSKETSSYNGESANEGVSTVRSPQESAPGLNHSDTIDSLRKHEEPVLTSLDVASFIINRMIGVGIFTNAPLVLWFCGNQYLALGVWFAGGGFSLLCFLVYAEYGTAWPYNGGELLYIDQIFRRLRRLNYLPALAYSFFMIIIGTAYPNAFGFAKHVLIAFNPNVSDPYDLNPHAVKGIAVAVLTVVTLVLYRHKWLAIRLNRLFALYKVGLLLVLSIIGFIYRREGIKWGRPANDGKFVPAFFMVLFSYKGWETPFYVLAELKARQSKSVLRRGGISAIVIVTLLYLMVNIAVMVVLSYDEIVVVEGFASIMQDPRAASAAAVLVSLSPVGNMIASIYAYAQLGRVIGEQKLVPFWQILDRGSNFKSPTSSGAYLVHWIACTVAIIVVATPQYSATNTAISMSVHVYGCMLFIATIAGSMLWTVQRGKRPHIYLWGFICSVVVVVNISVLIVTMIPSQQDRNAPMRMWLQPAIAFGSMVLGILWGLFIWMIELPGEPRQTQYRREETGSAASNAGAARMAQAVQGLEQLPPDGCNFLQRKLGVAVEIKPTPETLPPVDQAGTTVEATTNKFRGQTREVAYRVVEGASLATFLGKLKPPRWFLNLLWPDRGDWNDGTPGVLPQ